MQYHSMLLNEWFQFELSLTLGLVSLGSCSIPFRAWIGKRRAVLTSNKSHCTGLNRRGVRTVAERQHIRHHRIVREH